MAFNLNRIIKLSRPHFWLYLGGTYLVGFTIGISTISQFYSVSFFAHLFYFLFLANIFLYGINDYYDQATDVLNPKKIHKERALAEKEKKETLIIITIAGIIGILFLIWQNSALGKLAFILFLLLSYFYSAPPLRFKARPFLDFTSNILYILPGIIGYLQTANGLPDPVIILAVSVWAFAMHLFSAIPDIVPDELSGIKTSAVVLGKTKSLVLCFIFWSLFSGILLYKKIVFPFSLITLIYPIVPLFILLQPRVNILKVYWIYPYLNAVVGFLAFIVCIEKVFS